MTRTLSRLIFILLAVLTSTYGFAKGDTIRRFAFVVGANDGGSGRAKLRFANQDAESFVTVLNELGGVASSDTVLVRDASRASVNEGLRTLKDRILKSAAVGERQEVVFYYSGHADEDGLRLKSEILPYKDLKQMVMALPVQVQILVIDSCASGNLAMAKGGQRKPAFLMDVSSKAKGHAIITSSSENEAAQESASVGGSIFTHYFLSGLRGAADTNNDGKVTLGEAYQYAYAETLARTEKTMSGAQHPAYDFKLAGTGDVVLTDLRQSTSVLIIPEDSNGRYFVRQKNGDLIAEINKPSGRKVELGLAPGNYDVTYDRNQKHFQGSFALASNQRLSLNSAAFAAIDPEVNPTRGKKEYRVVPATIGLLPPLENWNTVESDELHNFSFDLLGGHSGKLKGMTLAGFGHVVDEDADGVMMQAGVNWVRGNLNGVQVSASLNHVAQNTNGAQMGIVNMTGGDVDGAQVGIVNTSANTTGAQVGIVNIAKNVKGVQVGIVNVSDDIEGAPIGVVSYVKNGRKDVDVSYDELGLTHASFRMGSKYVYTIYDCGLRTKGVKAVCGLGLGAIYERSGFFAAIESLNLQDIPQKYHGSTEKNDDGTIKKDDSRSSTFLNRTQLLLGAELIDHTWIYAGPSFSVSNRGSDEFDQDINPQFGSATHKAKLWSSWVGATGGIRYSF